MGGPLKKYEVVTPHGVTTTMKLNEADARRLGVLDAPATESESVAADGEEAAPVAKKRAASNKSRTAADKGGAGGGDD
ncbi:hypothetical protein ACFFSH_38410 [Streptomyces filamentosus]|uniref:Uncharacterized protein n=1 Tax=Streptomyces filamentosus TaxID=67294 RepID=A0A919BAX4_STRFL|nr:hypothetical protein [Streptomyces filamentosus]GHF77037.1 hypothetical protein GCM10017667_00400 [Streptomyces filamentosus]